MTEANRQHVEADISEARDVAFGDMYKVQVGEKKPDFPPLDLAVYADHLRRQLEELDASFTPLFLRRDATAAPPIYVAPARVVWSHRGMIEQAYGVVEYLEDDAEPIEKIVDSEPILTIRGDPGSGKSTSCRWLVYRLAGELSNDTLSRDQLAPVPILIELHRFQTRGQESPTDALARMVAVCLRDNGAIEAAYEADATFGRHCFVAADNTAPLALFLDGLNEVAPEFRDALYDAIRQLIDQWRGNNNRVYITTRRHGFEAFRLGNVKVFDIMPLGPDYIKQYLSRRLAKPQHDIEEIYNELGERVKLLTSNPLMLNLICEVLSRGESVPRSRAALLQLYVDGVLTRWEPSKSSDFGQRSFPTDEKKRVLEWLAYRMQLLGRSLPCADVATMFQQVLKSGSDRADARELLDELCTNELIRNRQGLVEFSHHALQEYCCSSALRRISQGAEPPKGERWQPTFDEALCDPVWWEPLSMIGGMLNEAELNDLVRRANAQPALAGMILGNADTSSPLQIRFTRRAKKTLRRRINASVLLTQGFLWTVIVVTGIVTVLALFRIRDLVPWFVSSLRIDPLDGVPWPFAWIAILCVLAFYVFDAAPRAVEWFHDWQLTRLYAGSIEPWLLALHYANSPQAETILATVHADYARRRYVDILLKDQLRSFAVRSIDTDRKTLLANLADPRQRNFTLLILGSEYDDALALRLVNELPHRHALRREAELELYAIWLRRFPESRQTMVPVLEELVCDHTQERSLRRSICRRLRREGLSKVRVWTSPSEWLHVVAWPVAFIFRILVGILVQPLIIFVSMSAGPRRLERVRGAVVHILAGWARLPIIHPGPHGLVAISSIQGLVNQRALQIVERGLSWYPNFPGLLGLRGDILHNLLEYAVAAESYRAALAGRPDHPPLLRNLASSLSLAGELEEAERVARRAVEVSPSDDKSWGELVEVLWDQERKDEARQQLADALAQFPNSTDLHWTQGGWHLGEQQYAEAAESYRAALARKPDHPPLLQNLASSLRLAGELEEAERVARRAVEVSPSDDKSWDRLVEVLWDQERKDEARQQLADALAQFPNSTDLHWTQGGWHFGEQQYAEAAESYRAALAGRPDHPPLLQNLASSLRLAGELKEADELSASTFALEPERVSNWRRRISVLNDLGKRDEANELLAKALTKFPRDVDLEFLATLMQIVDNDLDNALAMCISGSQHWLEQRSAIAARSISEPSERHEWTLLQAEVLLRLQQFSDARHCLDQIDHSPDPNWTELLRCLSSATAKDSDIDDPLICRFNTWCSNCSKSSAEIPDKVPTIPENRISRRVRQACLWLEAQNLKTAGHSDRAAELESQASSLSKFDLVLTTSLLECACMK